MNVEFFRRETSKKIMGLTGITWPAQFESIDIAKNLSPIDFIGMVLENPGTLVDQVDYVEVTSDGTYYTLHRAKGGLLKYYPETGKLEAQ